MQDKQPVKVFVPVNPKTYTKDIEPGKHFVILKNGNTHFLWHGIHGKFEWLNEDMSKNDNVAFWLEERTAILLTPEEWEGLKGAVEALEEIKNPISAMRKRAEAEGSQLNGTMAVLMSKDSSYLQQIAEAALSKLK